MALVDRETLTRQIRDAVDILDVVGSYVTLKRAGNSFKGLCPFHEEKTPSFHVNPSRQIFKCFGCGAGGDVFKFIQRRERIDFLEARRLLADRAGISLEQEKGIARSGPNKGDLARVNQWAQKIFRRNYEGPNGQMVRKYVSERKISDQSAESFGIGWAVDSYDSLIRQASEANLELKLLLAAGLVKERPSGGYYDTFRNRLMFPISDVSDRVVGFGGRTMGNDAAKYLNTPATALFDKGANLFGLDRARRVADKVGRIVVVEGYTDCIMAHQFGFNECVATLGTALTDIHANIIRRYTDRVILLFDSDEAGSRAADRALSVTLTGGLDVFLARVPEGQDPCDYLLSAGKSGLDSVLNEAMGALEFKWRQVSREYDATNTGPGRRRAIEAYLQQLSSWVGQGAIDQIQKGLLLNQLSKILSLPPEDLHGQLQSMTRRSPVYPVVSREGEENVTGATAIQIGKNAEQVALQQILEVLVNRPELYPTVEKYFDPARIVDPVLSAIAVELLAMLRSDGAFRIDELIGRFESVEYGRLITDLQIRGERRGGYQAVIEGVIPCLESVDQTRRAAMAADEIRRRKTNNDLAEQEASDEDKRLLELADGMRRPHFSTAKARKRFMG
ncbi:MAG: DNA primase [Planctomycetota bacterium]|nr:MAG: DNA primase [Planctomycetota bacterium]